jgi:hypothetical protein
MSATRILNEAQRLNSVSDRLDSLSDQNPVVSEALVAITVNVRNAATILQVLVVTTISRPSELQ